MGTAGSKVAHHEDADKPKDDAEVPKLRPWQWTVDQEGIQKQAGEMRAGGAAGCDDPIGIVTTVEDEDECFKDLEKSLAGRDPATLPPGPVGNTILHTALLRGKYKLARAILERYPQLVKVPYQLRRSLNDKNASMYEGETALHMAIVAKNVDMVRELLRVGGEKGCVEEMLKARACGEFFQRGGGVDSFYCGEFPLSFAVSVNDREIVNELLKSGADLLAQDSYGNTCLHLAVIHGLREMYTYLTELPKEGAAGTTSAAAAAAAAAAATTAKEEALLADVLKEALRKRIEQREKVTGGGLTVEMIEELDKGPGGCKLLKEGEKGKKEQDAKAADGAAAADKLLGVLVLRYQKQLIARRNSSGLTALSLAAVTVNTTDESSEGGQGGAATADDKQQPRELLMLEHMLGARRTQTWTYGPVAQYTMPLKGVDTVDRNTGRVDCTSVLHLAVAYNRKELFPESTGTPLSMLTDLLEAKWQLFGNWCMWVELAMYLVLMVITTLLVMAKRPGGEFFGRAAITCLDACGSCVGAEYLPSGTPDTCPGPHTAPHDATTYVSEGLGRLEAALFAFALIFAFLDVLDILLWIWTHRPVFLKAEEEKSRTAYEKVPPFYPRYSSSDAKSNGHGQQGGQKSPLLNPQQAEPAADVDGAAPLLTSAATEAPATGNRNGKSSSAPGNAYADAYYTQPTLPFPIRQIMWVQQEVHRFVGFIHRPVNASGSGSHGVRALNSGSWGKGSADSPSSGLHVLWQFLLHALGLLVHVFWHITTMAILQFDPTMLFLRIHWASALAHSGMWLTNSSGAAHLSLAVASIAGWLHVLYYVRVMRGVGHLVGTIFRMLYVDVLRFIVIYGVVLIGFACAAFLLATGEFVNGDTARIECEYCTLQHSMLSLFRLTLGDFDYAVTFSKYGAFGVVLFIAFSITSNILLLNLLIALLNNTFVKADTDQSYLWRLHRAQYILTVERRLWCNWRLLYLGHLGRPKKLTPTDSSTAGSKVWQWLQKHVLLGLPCHKETDYLYITYERQADYYHRPAAANGTDKKAAEAAAAAARSSSTDTNNA